MKEEIMGNLLVIHDKHPELRTGQILSIAANKGGWGNTDIFYCPDEVLLRGLEIIIDGGVK